MAVGRRYDPSVREHSLEARTHRNTSKLTARKKDKTPRRTDSGDTMKHQRHTPLRLLCFTSAVQARMDFKQPTVLAPEVPAETDPINIALIPPTDITPEAALVAYPKPIHTQSHPLNRYPQGALQSRCHGLIWMLKYFDPNTVLYCTDMDMDFYTMRLVARARRAGQRPHRNGKWPPSTFLNGQIQAFQDHHRSRCGKARFVFG